jgi:hypothetical protein
VTPAQKGIKARFESLVVLESNSYDDRPISIRIAHAGEAGPVDVGSATVRLTDLLSGGEVRIKDRSIVQMKIVAEPSPLRDGSSEGFALVVPVPPPPSGPPPRR